MCIKLLLLPLLLLSLGWSQGTPGPSVTEEEKRNLTKLIESHPFWNRITSKEDGVRRFLLVDVKEVELHPDTFPNNPTVEVTHVLYKNSGIYSTIRTTVFMALPKERSFKISWVADLGMHYKAPIGPAERQEVFIIALKDPVFKSYYGNSKVTIKMEPKIVTRLEDPQYGHRLVEVDLTLPTGRAQGVINLSTQQVVGRFVNLR